ncbi:MAG: ABC transporter substrate-binding protein [Acetobacteraceae bacterium]|nr:ABC transporter substrate-binding protein [Acetobacteraceae bacterium]
MSRRAALASGIATLCARPAHAEAAPAVHLGTVQFGTLQWVVDVIRRRGLDAARGFAVSAQPLANTDAGRIAMVSGQADIVVLDWMFVAVQRAAGSNLCFAPFSSATGGIMARADGPIQSLADLKDRRLGVAGGPADKSWLLVQAAARAHDRVDLARAASVVYGAPPLLGAKLQQGELDAVLTFWNFAARLEADGFRQVVSVSDCAVALGLPPRLDLVGFVFREDWARSNPALIGGFLSAAEQAERMLATSDEEWNAIRPLMNAPAEALFARLRTRFVAGIAPPGEKMDAATARLFAILKETGGTRATGGLENLPSGIFWRAPNGTG